MSMDKYEKKLRKEFGVYLRMQRLKANITQKEISKACGFSTPQFISNIERGVCPVPPDVLSIMAEIYELNKKVLARNYNNISLRLLENAMGVKRAGSNK